MSSDRMEQQQQQQQEETNRIMDEWQDAAMDIASDDDDDNNNNNNNENNIDDIREQDNDLFPTEIIEASGSNEMSEGSGTSSGMGSFVDVSNSVGNGDQGNNGDELVDVMSEEGSQNTDPSLVLVDRVGVLEEEDDDEEEEKEGEEDDTEEKDEQEKEEISSINEEIVVQKDEDDTCEHETILGDGVVQNEEVLSTPIRSNKVSESRNLDLSLEEKISSTEIKDELDDHTSKDTPLLMEENTKSQYEPNGDELNGLVEKQIESQDDHSSYMPGKSPRSQNYRMKHIHLRQKYVSSAKSTMENNNDNSSLFQSPSNLTSASQVTTVHRNTAIPSVNSNSSERSDMSTFGKEDIRSPPSSEIFLEEMERRRLRQIALEAVASSTAVNESNEAAKTVKEDRPYESGIKPEFDPYAPVNVHSSSSVPEMEMSETVVSSTSKDFFADPRQLRKGHIINTESNTSSNTCASNHTFENIPPTKSKNVAYIDVGRLIVVGVAGIIGGVIQSVFALTTCQFVNIQKKVGYYDEILVVHAGMSSFSPMDSVFQGHSNCISYNHKYYGQQAPVFAKANATLALICGGVSILILWVYNLTTKTTFELWNTAKGCAVAAAVFQLLTFQFFVSAVCKDEMCRMGTGSAASLVAACIYFLMAFEMNRNCPARRSIPGLVNALMDKNVGHSTTKDKNVQESESFYSAPNLV